MREAPVLPAAPVGVAPAFVDVSLGADPVPDTVAKLSVPVALPVALPVAAAPVGPAPGLPPSLPWPAVTTTGKKIMSGHPSVVVCGVWFGSLSVHTPAVVPVN